MTTSLVGARSAVYDANQGSWEDRLELKSFKIEQRLPSADRRAKDVYVVFKHRTAHRYYTSL